MGRPNAVTGFFGTGRVFAKVLVDFWRKCGIILIFRKDQSSIMAKIIGRQKEAALLQSLLTLDRSAFVAIYGRRRVGKTFLIRSVYEGQFTFQVTGIANVGLSNQLTNFHAALVRHFPHMEDKPVAGDWFWSFQNLISALESLPKEGKKVLFLDELPWLDSPNSMFVSSIEHFWNSWASARSDIVLVVCGSAASWMPSTAAKKLRCTMSASMHCTAFCGS